MDNHTEFKEFALWVTYGVLVVAAVYGIIYCLKNIFELFQVLLKLTMYILLMVTLLFLVWRGWTCVVKLQVDTPFNEGCVMPTLILFSTAKTAYYTLSQWVVPSITSIIK